MLGAGGDSSSPDASGGSGPTPATGGAPGGTGGSLAGVGGDLVGVGGGPSSGGTASTGGSMSTGGATATGGTSATGGSETGGSTATGGMTATGGGSGDCSVPAWDSGKAYPGTGTQVSLDGTIYENCYYANAGDNPSEKNGGTSCGGQPWRVIGPC